MWRWHSIVNKKTAGDQGKGKAYAKVWKIITIAARKWMDPDLNPSLALALQKAKQYNLPRDVIDKAIKKWSGANEGEELFEISYEWYGPGWVALYIEAITSNTNRSATNVKTIVQKHGGVMWTPWSVIWQFKNLGMIIIDWLSRIELEKWKEVEYVDKYDQDELEWLLLELDIDDIEFEDAQTILTTTRENYHQVLHFLDNAGYHIVSSWLHWTPDNTVTLDSEQDAMFQKMLIALEEDDDVDSVAHNLAE